MTLYELVFNILKINTKPISRVRLTKAIYFAHKELIRKGFMHSEDIAYLRLPLGPVPVGFLQLPTEHPDIKVRSVPSDILYATEEYYVEPNKDKPAISQEAVTIIEQILRHLHKHPTPELVLSSQDPSWRNHQNGEEYYISAADLRNSFPIPHIRLKIRIRRHNNPIDHAGTLQAHLIRGMLEDIVKESTDLEYPDEPQGNKAKKHPADTNAPRSKSTPQGKQDDY